MNVLESHVRLVRQNWGLRAICPVRKIEQGSTVTDSVREADEVRVDYLRAELGHDAQAVFKCCKAVCEALAVVVFGIVVGQLRKHVSVA